MEKISSKKTLSLFLTSFNSFNFRVGHVLFTIIILLSGLCIKKAQSSTLNLEFEKSNLMASLVWVNSPKVNRDSSFRINFHRLDGLELEEDVQIKVDLWMPEMGHGSAPVRLERKGAGEFLVKNVFFIMPGHWQVRIKVQGSLGWEEKIQRVDL